MRAFASIPVGDTFDYAGNLYLKRSSRTAVIVFGRGYNPDALRWFIHTDHSGTWHYFAQCQTVDQERKWWADIKPHWPRFIRAAGYPN